MGTGGQINDPGVSWEPPERTSLTPSGSSSLPSPVGRWKEGCADPGPRGTEPGSPGIRSPGLCHR